MRLANDACGVANAATRKYLTADHLWYYPPPDAFMRLAEYANNHGDPSGKPYFSQDGRHAISAEQWSRMRAKFRCPAGVTNVWRQPQVAGKHRINGDRQRMQWKYKSLHGSQKPLGLIEITILATTDPGDAVWEPFGGLCPAAICAFQLGRVSHSAEIVSEFYNAAVERLHSCQESLGESGATPERSRAHLESRRTPLRSPIFRINRLRTAARTSVGSHDMA